MIAPWGWGMALTAAIYVCGGVSGGHVNPAVTLGMASVGKLPWRKVPHYFLGQYIGAFLGAVVTYIVYQEPLINKFGTLSVSGDNATAGIFGTFPTSSNGTCFLDQTIAVSFFLLLICAITDKNNMQTPKGLIPVAIGVCDLGLMIFSFGYNCGAPINPARDFAPRLFSSMAGWGSEVFR
jgi:MIP family channel proteins